MGACRSFFIARRNVAGIRKLRGLLPYRTLLTHGLSPRFLARARARRIAPQRHLSRGKLAEDRRVRIGCGQFTLDHVVHCRFSLKVTAFTRQESQQRDLIVTIRVNLELAAVVPIRDERLVQLGHLERTRHVLRVAGANILHQSIIQAIKIVHFWLCVMSITCFATRFSRGVN